MIDIVFPNQNEEGFVKMAEKLGYTALCFFYKELKPVYLKHIENMQASTKVKLYTASSVSNKIRPDMMIINTTDPRQWLEGKKGDMIYGVEANKDRDSITHIRSGLNQVLCSIAKQKGKIIGFDYGLILNSSGQKRLTILRRIMQNIKLCKKYQLMTVIASFSNNPIMMRNASDIKCLFSLLGMDDYALKMSFESAEQRIKENHRKRSKDYIGEGIERI
ncbi:MAG: hypothetical protein KKE20_03995 [Nanoarchaeota archaeon]|nr:hypothetical protein [Nanoarchaeota archaeon]